MKPLSGLGVLVTRPAHQAGPLIELLQHNGAKVYPLPVIEIESLPVTTLQSDVRYDIMIFISANAVFHGIKILQKAMKKPNIAAIGQATARTLTELGAQVNLVPKYGFTSEALLDLPELSSDKISGKHILIIRGSGGREILADSLKTRGAKVDYAEVYRRICPSGDINWLLPLWKNHNINMVMVTSNEALENLYHMLKNQNQWLLATPLIVPGERCHALAKQLGFNSIVPAASPSDEDMLQATLHWQISSASK